MFYTFSCLTEVNKSVKLEKINSKFGALVRNCGSLFAPPEGRPDTGLATAGLKLSLCS